MRTYRLGATLGPFLGWNALLALPIVAFLAPAQRWESYAIAALLILAGPVALGAYLVRYARIRVAIEPAGLRLSDRYFVRWSEIRKVERRGWRVKPWNPFEDVPMPGVAWVFMILLFLVVCGLLALALAFWLFRVVVVPVLVLLSPWQPSVAIELADGTRLVYRDLSDAEEFVSRVAQRIPESA